MSDNETTETASSETKKAREPKKNSIPKTEVDAMVAGIPQYSKASFVIVGHKGGVRLALPKTAGVSRAFFYGNGDYSLIPDDPSITQFSEADRKEQHRGGVMAELNFEHGLDAAKAALQKLVDVVRAAPAPEPKLKPTPKAKRADPTQTGTVTDQGDTESPEAELAD